MPVDLTLQFCDHRFNWWMLFPATSRYCSNGYLINCTDALEIIVGLTGECKLRNPRKMESLDNCIDAQFEHHQSNRCWTLALASGSAAPMIHPIVGSSGALCWLGLYWAHCTGECNLPHVGWTGECKLPMSWSFRPDFFEVLYLFIPCTYKPDNVHLNTYISPSVVCIINCQNIILKYGMRPFSLQVPLYLTWR